ncbi:MAG: type II toxin-antitoxin system VapC family toxin [Deltaproteobacteria bacterium]|nr:type II toxin-antitoxin system VapC family toxin [Deltaproteobacteria bacterium]
MIIPDINLLIYAYNADAPLHSKACLWWEELINLSSPIAIPWVVSCGFIRLMTHTAVLQFPMFPAEAVGIVASWYERRHVQVINPGPRHLAILGSLFTDTKVAGNLTTDTHLAAIAIEYQCEIHSNDYDFSRFKGLRWSNPFK